MSSGGGTKKRSRSRNSETLSPLHSPAHHPLYPGRYLPPAALSPTSRQEAKYGYKNEVAKNSKLVVTWLSAENEVSQLDKMQELLKRTSLAELQDKELLQYLNEMQHWMMLTLNKFTSSSSSLTSYGASGVTSPVPFKFSNNDSSCTADESSATIQNPDILYADSGNNNTNAQTGGQLKYSGNKSSLIIRDVFDIFEVELIIFSVLKTFPWWRMVEGASNVEKDSGGAHKGTDRKHSSGLNSSNTVQIKSSTINKIAVQHEKIIIAFEKVCLLLAFYNADYKSLLEVLCMWFQSIPPVRDGADRRMPIDTVMRVMNYMATASLRQTSGPHHHSNGDVRSWLTFTVDYLFPKRYWDNKKHHLAATVLLLHLALEGFIPAYVPHHVYNRNSSPLVNGADSKGRENLVGGSKSGRTNDDAWEMNDNIKNPNLLLDGVYELLKQNGRKIREIDSRLEKDPNFYSNLNLNKGLLHTTALNTSREGSAQGNQNSNCNAQQYIVNSEDSNTESLSSVQQMYFSPTANDTHNNKFEGVPFPSSVNTIIEGNKGKEDAVNNESSDTDAHAANKNILMGDKSVSEVDVILNGQTKDPHSGLNQRDGGLIPANENHTDTDTDATRTFNVNHWVYNPQNNRLLSFRNDIIQFLFRKLFALESTLSPSELALEMYNYRVSISYSQQNYSNNSSGLQPFSNIYTNHHTTVSSLRSSRLQSPRVSMPSSPVAESPSVVSFYRLSESEMEDELTFRYAQHREMMNKVKKLKEFFTVDTQQYFEILRDCATVTFYRLKEDLQTQQAAGLCGNTDWWNVICEFFFYNLIIQSTPSVSSNMKKNAPTSAFQSRFANRSMTTTPSSTPRSATISATVQGMCADDRATEVELVAPLDLQLPSPTASNPQRQTKDYYRCASYVLLYICPSLAHFVQEEGINLLHRLVKIVTEGVITFSPAHGETNSGGGLGSTVGNKNSARRNTGNMLPPRMNAVGNTYSKVKHDIRLIEVQCIHAALHLFPLFRFLFPTLNPSSCVGVFRRLAKWLASRRYERRKIRQQKLQCAFPSAGPSLKVGSTFSNSSSLNSPQPFAHYGSEADPFFIHFTKLEEVIFAQCAAMAQYLGEELVPNYELYKKKKEEEVEKEAKRQQEEEEIAQSTKLEEGTVELNPVDAQGKTMSTGEEGKQALTKNNKVNNTQQSGSSTSSSAYRYERELEPFVERFRVRVSQDETKEETRKSDSKEEPSSDDKKEKIIYNLRQMEVEGLLRTDLFNFCPWPLPHQQ